MGDLLPEAAESFAPSVRRSWELSEEIERFGTFVYQETNLVDKYNLLGVCSHGSRGLLSGEEPESECHQDDARVLPGKYFTSNKVC